MNNASSQQDSFIHGGNEQLPQTRVPHYYSVEMQSTSVPSFQLVGLRNLGVTCWFNVVIQLLYHIPKFRKAILEFGTKTEQMPYSNPSCPVLVLQNLFSSISFSDNKQINPANAYESIGKLLENGVGQQDASEYLAVLLENIGTVMPRVVESLFYGTCKSRNSRGPCKDGDKFLQYSIQINGNTNLLAALESSLTSQHVDPLEVETHNKAENLMQHFVQLPPVFLINISRLVPGNTPYEFVKNDHVLSFPSVLFMDRFMFENAEQMSNTISFIKAQETKMLNNQSKLVFFDQILENLPKTKTTYECYQSLVDTTAIDFSILSSLNMQWEQEVRAMVPILEKDICLIDQEIYKEKNRRLPTVRPYQLHAILLHQGQSNVGHYCIFVWNSYAQTWFYISDDSFKQVTWDSISQAAFGGVESNSAHCLIYIDTLEVHSLLDLDEECTVRCEDVLCYLKDPTDIRTRHASYAKSQTFKAVFDVISDKQRDPSSLLYQALDNERRRLFCVLDEWVNEPIDNEVRLRHFVVYLLANRISFEPFVYWTLLQHFSIFALQAQKRTNGVCIAARRSLAFLENSLPLFQKKIFIAWNTSYHKFQLIIRHVLAAFTHLFAQNFSAAVPLAVKALYLHYDLMKTPLRGPAMSIKPFVIHSLIKTSLISLSRDLLNQDLATVGDIVCTVLFDGIINWCEYTDAANLDAVRSTSRFITSEWKQLAELSTSVTELQGKIQKVESILNSNNRNESAAPLDFKGHIPENVEDGDKLALKWNRTLKMAMERNVFFLGDPT